MTRYIHLHSTLMLLGISILPLAAQVVESKTPDWVLNPGTAAADQPFSLEALTYEYSCANTYANQKVTVTGMRIDLGFTTKVNPAVLCPAIYKPYGPAFEMPALAEGQYSVFMNLLSACHVAAQPCASVPPIESAGTLVVGRGGKISYTINPNKVRAGTEFTLNLLSPQFTCNLEYLRLASRVQDGRITLTFLDKPNPLVRCAPEKDAYGPAYRMAGLAAGTYEVWAERLPACAEQGCKMAPTLDSVGKLTVATGSPVKREGWYLSPKDVVAGRPFVMGVVNEAYGNCNTTFDHTSLVVGENRITVSFVIVDHPEHVCIVDIRPHGPTFDMAAMRAGIYPVFVQTLPACMFAEPRCVAAAAPPLVVPADTLIVMQPLGLEGVGPSAPGPRAAWREGALTLRLPEGARGPWRAEVLDLSGKRLHSTLVDPTRGTARLAFPAPDRGLVLVRLSGPGEGETHTLRVAVP